MSAELLIANLLRIASEDLEVRDCSPRTATATRSTCEQAAEEVIRAVVFSEGQHAGIKHELAEMVSAAPSRRSESISAGSMFQRAT